MNTEQDEIDLLQLFFVILNKWWVAFSGAVIGTVIAFLITSYILTPQYTSSIEMYINNNNNNANASSLTINDITVSKNLVNTYSVILKTRLTLEDVIKETGLNCSYEDLNSMIKTEAVNDTEILKVSVQNSDPDMAYAIADTIGKVLPEHISKIVEGSSVSIVDKATLPEKPSSPSIIKNSAIGFIMGAIVAVGVILLLFFFNDQIDSVEKLQRFFHDDIPILAIIPDVNSDNHGKRQKYGSYSSNQINKK